MSESTIPHLREVDNENHDVLMAPENDYLTQSMLRIEKKLDNTIKQYSEDHTRIALLEEKQKISQSNHKLIRQLSEDFTILKTKYGLIAALVIFLGTLIPNVIFHLVKILGGS